MVYRILYKFIFILIFFFFKSLLYANVVYDKNKIIISELDINYYKQMHYDKFSEYINDSKALKNLVKIKKLVSSLKRNNKIFLTKIDNNIDREIGKENISSETIYDIIRYFNVRNEFIYDFFNNSFNSKDLENIFGNLENLELPVSENNCLTITKLVDLKNNAEFYDVFFKNIKQDSKVYEITIDNLRYNVCINQRNSKIIEKEIFKYIDFKIQNDFDRFVYEQQNR